MVENSLERLLAGTALGSGSDAYKEPKRRHAGRDLATTWFALMCDEVDYGMLLVEADGRVVYMNHAARVELDGQHPLQLVGAALQAQCASDVVQLHDALTAAQQRKLRRLLMLGEGEHRVSISVVPLPSNDGHEGMTLLMLGKRQVSQRLSLQAFARGVALTPAETRVLESLCEGLDPREIARQNAVGLATVRSQIHSIRAKTGAPTVGALVRQVAVLPPLVEALRGSLPR